MSNILVTYFSAEGNTAKVAGTLAAAIEADSFEIVPEKPYTRADIRWTNPLARCNREMLGRKDVPVAGKVDNMADYDVIFVGFPIWYGCAPNVVNTFLNGYDLDGKKIGVFATSGGSGIGKTAKKLMPYVGNATIVDARIVSPDESTESLQAWALDVMK